MLYNERIDVRHDAVFWCGHRAFTSGQAIVSNINDTDHFVIMANGAFVVVCEECFVSFVNGILDNPLYIPETNDSKTVWCGHRAWIDYEGQPETGDRSFIAKGCTLVACPDCATKLALAFATKAARLVFEDAELLNEIIEAD